MRQPPRTTRPDTLVPYTRLCRAQVGDKHLALGNTALMDQKDGGVTIMATTDESLRTKGASVMYLSTDGQLIGLLAVSDPIKKSTPEAVKGLKAAGIRVIMATGDGISTEIGRAHV